MGDNRLRIVPTWEGFLYCKNKIYGYQVLLTFRYTVGKKTKQSWNIIDIADKLAEPSFRMSYYRDKLKRTFWVLEKKANHASYMNNDKHIID